MNIYPTIRKIQSFEEQRAVCNAAIENGDNMVFPSHVALKGDEIVGGYCLGNIPIALMWNHTEKMKVRDSMFCKGVVDSIMSDRGTPSYFIACNSNSPYYQHMEQFGFKPVWPTNIFYT